MPLLPPWMGDGPGRTALCARSAREGLRGTSAAPEKSSAGRTNSAALARMKTMKAMPTLFAVRPATLAGEDRDDGEHDD